MRPQTSQKRPGTPWDAPETSLWDAGGTPGPGKPHRCRSEALFGVPRDAVGRSGTPGRVIPSRPQSRRAAGRDDRGMKQAHEEDVNDYSMCACGRVLADCAEGGTDEP